MEDLTSAYISGVWHGALGVAFIVAGLLGWPQTRFILTLIFRRKPRHPIGKPVGSLGTTSVPFWEQYGIRHSERGFAIAPILYLLGLIGILGGALYSSNMQILKSNIVAQSSVTAKSDLQGATNTLSAQSVFSADGLTLCPPRSTHETNGNPCDAAPIGLTQFSDLPVSEVAQLPGNYANAGSTGSPTEVGVFTAGAGTHMLDPYGHLYIYCRWENPRSNPGAPAFVLLSGGDDEVLQTTCGGSAAQNDDYLYSLSVGEAINRAALWQSTSSSGVTYGAVGTQVAIDNSGNITALNITTSYAYFNQATFYWPLMWYGSQLLKLTDYADVKLGPTQMSDDSFSSTALGQSVLNNLTSSAVGDTGAGSYAGYNITTGSVDTALGAYSLSSNTDGGYNTAVGASAQQYGTTGSYNTAVGTAAFQYGSGSYNTTIGYNAGSVTLRTGSYNILIGYGADVPTASTGSWLNIGGFIQGSLANQTLGIGTSSPQATLDVNGYMRLMEYSSPPATCSASNDGAMVLTSHYKFCVCSSSNGWVSVNDGVTTCSF